jgi:transcriptional regulator with XRE-family HTH domain
MAIQHCLEGLKPIRQFRRIERKDLAQTIGVTVTSYDRYESGDRRIQFDKVCVLADFLYCTTEDLRRFYTPEELELMLRPMPLKDQLAEPNSPADRGTVVSRGQATPSDAPPAPPPPPGTNSADLPPPPPPAAAAPSTKVAPPPPPPHLSTGDEDLDKILKGWD